MVNTKIISKKRYITKSNGVVIDKAWKPIALQWLKESIEDSWLLRREIMKILDLFDKKKWTINRRVEILCNEQWLTHKRLSNNRKVFVYTLSGKAKAYLRKHGDFMNPNGYLMRWFKRDRFQKEKIKQEVPEVKIIEKPVYIDRINTRPHVVENKEEVDLI